MDLLKPGQVFVGRYRIERELARGGMGVVLVGEQIATEMPVAIKVLFPHILSSEDAVAKFELEAKVAARVNSDHIVKVIDAGYDPETHLPFLVMELLEGRDLGSIVETDGPLSPDLTVKLIGQVADGLDRAHGYTNRAGVREPIVHRDLKPENLFLTQRQSGEPVVKILDFGIAKALTDTAKVSQEIKGTPLYMAFEQATGSALSPQTDIWALGLVTFFLLTGRAYWKVASSPNACVSALFAEVLNLPVDPPSQRAAHLGLQTSWPPGFDQWFLRCVNRDPAARFSSAGEAARELVHALGLAYAPAGDAAVSAHTPAGQGLSEVVSAVLTLPAARGTEGSLALSRTARSRRPASSTKSIGIALAALAVVAGMGVGAWWLLGSTSARETEPTLASSALRADVAVGASAVAAASTAPPAPPAPSTEPAVSERPPSSAPNPSAQPPAAPPPRPAAHRPTAVAKPTAQPAAPPPGSPRTDVYGER